MEKKTVLIMHFVLFSILNQAQNIDYNTIILPINATEIDFTEKLVRLAWQNNPMVAVLQSELSKTKLEVKYSSWNWLDNIRITGNLNEFNIDQSKNPNGGSQFFPRYNISASISLGTFVTNPLETKVKRENTKISFETINAKKLELRAEVLKRYQTYLSNKEIFDLRTQMEEDAYSDYKLKEQNFSRGSIQINEYSASLERYNQQKINKIQAEKEMLISRYELEELIGIKLADLK